MTIEQRLLKDYGETNYAEHAVWLLQDGTLVNGSYEGHQRDVDHSEIGQYFHRSVREDPGSSHCYIVKFMRRGNIRISCSNYSYCAELRRIPTQRQLRVLSKIMNSARRNSIQTYVEWRSKRNVKYNGNWYDYLRYIRRYTDLISPNLLYKEA